MIKSAIRGGLSYVAQHHALANFPAMPNYRPDLPMLHLLYLDYNSLYTTCQTYLLLVGGFRFLTAVELLAFDVAGVPADSPTVYLVECDLRYPAKLHALHNAYLLAPEHVHISEEMLSDTLRLMQDVTGVTHLPCTKLVSNLHYRCLQFCLAHGLCLVKIHRIVAFSWSTYMLLFIKFCNDEQQNMQSDFESLLYKLIANAFFGKMVENVCKCTNIRLIADLA